MYYLVKEAVYQHGIYWIGEDLEEGKKQADKAAKLDSDAHHHWCIKKYKEDFEDGAYAWKDEQNKVIYIGLDDRRIDHYKQLLKVNELFEPLRSVLQRQLQDIEE